MLLVYRYPLKIRFPENNVHTFHLSPNFSRDILKILLKFKMGLYIIPANVCTYEERRQITTNLPVMPIKVPINACNLVKTCKILFLSNCFDRQIYFQIELACLLNRT